LRDLFAAEMGYKSGSQTRALTRGTFSLDNLTELVAVLLDLSPRASSCGDLCVQSSDLHGSDNISHNRLRRKRLGWAACGLWMPAGENVAGVG